MQNRAKQYCLINFKLNDGIFISLIDFVHQNLHVVVHLSHAEEEVLLAILVAILDQSLAVGGVFELVSR